MKTKVRREEGPRVISAPRLLSVFAGLGLIAFSSTLIAGESSDFAFFYYKHLLGFGGTGSGAGLHTLAQKGVHFVLFFALGTAVFQSFKVERLWKIGLAVGIFFLVGMGSEALEHLFQGRHASLADVLLNGSSGTLATLFCSRRG